MKRQKRRNKFHAEVTISVRGKNIYMRLTKVRRK